MMNIKVLLLFVFVSIACSGIKLTPDASAPAPAGTQAGTQAGTPAAEVQETPNALVEQPLSKWLQLEPVHAYASSYLSPSGKKYAVNYHPIYALDGDPETAWVEGAEGHGQGERWSVSLMLPDKMSRELRVRIRNGYPKTDELFRANGAIQVLDVKISASEEHMESRLSLENTSDWQEVLIDLPDWGEPIIDVEFIVQSVYAGEKYEDTCLSDVEFYVRGPWDEKDKAKQMEYRDERKQWIIKQSLLAKGELATLPDVAFWINMYQKANNTGLTETERAAILDEVIEKVQSSRDHAAIYEWQEPTPHNLDGLPSLYFILDDDYSMSSIFRTKFDYTSLLVPSTLHLMNKTNKLLAVQKTGSAPADLGGEEGWFENFNLKNPIVTWHLLGVPALIEISYNHSSCRTACGSNSKSIYVIYSIDGLPMFVLTTTTDQIDGDDEEEEETINHNLILLKYKNGQFDSFDEVASI